ncbi:hypothetical protein R3P38DRAFT_2800673 [Favolaschia claudopus]|uniref:Uncharacterized protein n=1 Tax=Favolaschia claudopus TaxID=2862362 RepID=A0AAV9ZX64_9AGAR
MRCPGTHKGDKTTSRETATAAGIVNVVAPPPKWRSTKAEKKAFDSLLHSRSEEVALARAERAWMMVVVGNKHRGDITPSVTSRLLSPATTSPYPSIRLARPARGDETQNGLQTVAKKGQRTTDEMTEFPRRAEVRVCKSCQTTSLANFHNAPSLLRRRRIPIRRCRLALSAAPPPAARVEHTGVWFASVASLVLTTSSFHSLHLPHPATSSRTPVSRHRARQRAQAQVTAYHPQLRPSGGLGTEKERDLYFEKQKTDDGTPRRVRGMGKVEVDRREMVVYGGGLLNRHAGRGVRRKIELKVARVNWALNGFALGGGTVKADLREENPFDSGFGL